MAEVKEVAVPDIGDFSDVPVIEVLVEPGQAVQAEDPLVTLESDKATMEVPAPFGGVIRELKVAVGDTVSEGSPIVTIVEDLDQAAPAEAAAPGAVESAVQAESSEAAVEQPPPSPPPAAPVTASAPPPEAAPAPPSADGARVYASPSARRLARELGVNLGAVAGSGREGRITREDVQAAADGAAAPAAREAAPAPAAGPVLAGLPPWPQVDFADFGEVQHVELPRIKRISGPNVARNWVAIPHVTQFDEADITDLEAFRKQLNAEQDVKVTMVALLLKACVASLKAFPDFNASISGNDGLVLKRYYHLGFAADTPGGLVVPVIRDVDRKGLLEVAAELRELSGRAREGKLKFEEMRGGTFTISSLGGIGGTAFTPIINAPEVAILGVSRSVTKAVWDGSEFVPRLMLPLSLSYDHRVIDGAAAARFTTHLAGVLADLRRVLL
jgi:pyruvate dehydrogenase E2 component (dihydrolipoamide acetyltransferase)